jgi:tripartite-type tricarboxylate transporter receptor subunit TctC
MRFLRRWLAAAMTVATMVTMVVPAAASTYPDRVIKLVLPFPAGSATDAVSRFIADELRKAMGQTVVVENQAGADGIIAAQAVKRAAPDGYTLMVSTNSAHGSNRALYAQLPYDPETDFEPVGTLMRIPQLLVVRSDFPASDMAGFVGAARERGATKPLSFGTGNTSSRIAGELLKVATRLDMAPVPYRGTPQALQDLVGGQIELFFADPYAASGLLTAGQIKALAITDTSRLASLPQVPTMAEAGFPSVELVSWAGVFAPARTDPAIVERLNREINRILATPQAREYIQKMGAAPMVMDRVEFRRFVSTEIARWGRLVDMAGIPKK